jgi:hypothetical protein
MRPGSIVHKRKLHSLGWRQMHEPVVVVVLDGGQR